LVGAKIITLDEIERPIRTLLQKNVFRSHDSETANIAVTKKLSCSKDYRAMGALKNFESP